MDMIGESGGICGSPRKVMSMDSVAMPITTRILSSIIVISSKPCVELSLRMLSYASLLLPTFAYNIPDRDAIFKNITQQII